MISWQLIAGAILTALAFASGWQVSDWRNKAAQKKADEVEQRATTAATDAAVKAIQGIEVKYVTIKQKAETITREVPIYRDCMHTDDGLRVVNEALTGNAAAGDPTVMPGPDATH
jgi:hypothetical protein